MKLNKYHKLKLFLLFLLISFKMSASVQVTDIRCENLKNPLGIDKLQPSFNWKISSDQRGTFQKAYQIMVASSPDKLKEGKPDYWDSQKIESGSNTFAAYKGKPLSSASKYYWKVKIWNHAGEATPWSEPAFFVTGKFCSP